MKCAIEIEKRQSKGARSSLKDCLNRTIAEYNRSVTVKKHRVDAQRKQLIYNLCLVFEFLCASESMWPCDKELDTISKGSDYLIWIKVACPTGCAGYGACPLRQVSAWKFRPYQHYSLFRFTLKPHNFPFPLCALLLVSTSCQEFRWRSWLSNIGCQGWRRVKRSQSSKTRSNFRKSLQRQMSARLCISSGPQRTDWSQETPHRLGKTVVVLHMHQDFLPIPTLVGFHKEGIQRCHTEGQGLQEWDLGWDFCMLIWLGASTSPHMY